MSRTNREKEYKRLIKLNRHADISENLQKEFGKGEVTSGITSENLPSTFPKNKKGGKKHGK